MCGCGEVIRRHLPCDREHEVANVLTYGLEQLPHGALRICFPPLTKRNDFSLHGTESQELLDRVKKMLADYRAGHGSR